MTMFNGSTDSVPLAADGYNPFGGLTPSFGPFAGILNDKVGIFLALVWAIAFVYAAYKLIVGGMAMLASRRGGYGSTLDESRTEVLWAAGGVVFLVALPVIYGVLATS